MIMQVPVEGLINHLNCIRSKIEEAAGAATFLELYLRMLAQSTPKMHIKIKEIAQSKNHRKFLYHNADLSDLIDATIETFQDMLSLEDRTKIKNCCPPRNKVAHGSFAELMFELSGESLGMEIDPKTSKHKPIDKTDIINGARSIERNGGLERFARQANKATEIIKTILRFQEASTHKKT